MTVISSGTLPFFLGLKLSLGLNEHLNPTLKGRDVARLLLTPTSPSRRAPTRSTHHAALFLSHHRAHHHPVRAPMHQTACHSQRSPESPATASPSETIAGTPPEEIDLSIFSLHGRRSNEAALFLARMQERSRDPVDLQICTSTVQPAAVDETVTTVDDAVIGATSTLSLWLVGLGPGPIGYPNGRPRDRNAAILPKGHSRTRPWSPPVGRHGKGLYTIDD